VNMIPPGVVVAVLLVLITSQVFYAALRYRRRAYLPVLLTTALGFGLGQLPAVVFALLLQPLARFVPRAGQEPKETVEQPPAT